MSEYKFNSREIEATSSSMDFIDRLNALVYDGISVARILHFVASFDWRTLSDMRCASIYGCVSLRLKKKQPETKSCFVLLESSFSILSWSFYLITRYRYGSIIVHRLLYVNNTFLTFSFLS